MEKLVEKAKMGDDNAFEKLMINIQRDLYKIARLRLKNYEDAEEAVQETIIKIYNNIKELRENIYFRTWAIRILINKCNEIYNKNIHNKCLEEKYLFKHYYCRNENEMIDSNIDFELLINKLKKEEKIIVKLFYIDRLSNKEISKILKLPESTVKNKLARARKKLKKIIQHRKNSY